MNPRHLEAVAANEELIQLRYRRLDTLYEAWTDEVAIPYHEFEMTWHANRLREFGVPVRVEVGG